MTTPLLHFARYREIAADVAARVAGGAEDAVVASGGVASAILAEALRNAPRGAVSLRLPTIETFALAVVNDAGEYPRIAGDMEQRLAMRTAARLAADRIIDSQALAAMLQRSYRDVRDAGLTLDAFEAKIPKLRNRRRSEAMLRAWREYERLIDALGAVDPSEILLRAAAVIGQPGLPVLQLKPQIIAGFYDMTGAQLRIVHALAAAGKLARIYVPSVEGEAFSARFVALLPKCTVAPAPALLHIKEPSVSIAQYENELVELREVSREIAGLVEQGVAPATIGIVGRSLEAYDVRLLQRFAGENGFAIAAGESRRLVAHRIGRGVVNLLRMRTRNFPRTSVIDLLRDGFETSRQINIDEIDGATRKESIAGGTGDALRSVPDYASAVAELETLAPSVPLPGGDWAALIRSIAARFRPETELDLDALQAIDAIASLFGRTREWNRRFDVDAVCDLFEQASLPEVQPSSGGIWASNVMRFRGRTFEHVFAVRMQDDVFPQRRSDDPLLPESDRRALGLREIGDGLDEELLLFRLLQDGAATSIRLTLAGSDGAGKLLRPSPFVKQLAIQREPARRAAILRDFGKIFAVSVEEGGSEAPPSRLIRQLQRIQLAGTHSHFDGYLTIDDAIRERINNALATLSPTALEDFGECPQRFLWKRVLGVRDLDEPELELHVNARDKGMLDHTILERFYRTLDERDFAPVARLRPELRERLEAIVDEVFDEFEAKVPPFNPVMRGIERRSTKRNLEAFIVSDIADLHDANMRPAHFEYAFGPRRKNAAHPEAFVITAHDVPMTIEGRIDRIDEGPDRIRVVDYKGGKALRHTDLSKKIDRGVRMQLALYAMAVAEFFGRDEKTVTGAIKPLRGGKDEKFSFSLADHAPRLRETLDLFAASIIAARFPAFPMENDQLDSCAYCPVNHSCRTRHDDAEKYAVTRAGDARSLLGA